MEKLCVTLLAALKLSFPACAAVKVHVPSLSIVTVNVTTVHTLVVPEVNDTSEPELAVGESTNVSADQARSSGSANVTV
jgi:hypothetical protein